MGFIRFVTQIALIHIYYGIARFICRVRGHKLGEVHEYKEHRFQTCYRCWTEQHWIEEGNVVNDQPNHPIIPITGTTVTFE
jgi:hypothetical protein